MVGFSQLDPRPSFLVPILGAQHLSLYEYDYDDA